MLLSVFSKSCLLGHHADHQGPVLDQADRPVLQLPSRIGLGMDIADLFHLQASLKADGIVDAAPDKEDILCIGVLARKPLDTLLVVQGLLDLSPGAFPAPRSAHRTAPHRSVPFANAAWIASRYTAISCVLYAFVVATEISGPA